MSTENDPQAYSLIEQSMLEIWRAALGRAEVGLDDDFFALGGDSLMALVTIEQTNQRLGWKLNLGDLLRCRTIRALTESKAVAQAANGERALVRMSNRGAKTAIVFIHSVSGMILAYSKLVNRLGADRACYGLQSPILTGESVPDTIEDLAELYADMIADELGEDEFHLVGWSGGGVIALEVAKLAAPKSLGLQRLVLIDSHIWDDSPLVASEQGMLREFRDDLLSQAFPHRQPDLSGESSLEPAAVFGEVAAALFGAAAQRAGQQAEFVAQLYEAYCASFRVLAGYRPSPAPLGGLLLHSAKNDTVETWRRVMGGELTVEASLADHYGLVRDPDAADIAARIEAYCH